MALATPAGKSAKNEPKICGVLEWQDSSVLLDLGQALRSSPKVCWITAQDPTNATEVESRIQLDSAVIQHGFGDKDKACPRVQEHRGLLPF